MIRVLIADDQALVRAGFRMIIDDQPDMEVVGEAGDGAEAVELTRRLLPQVVLMDVRMPTMDGLEATRRLASQATQPLRVVILTTYDLDEYVFDALAAGATLVHPPSWRWFAGGAIANYALTPHAWNAILASTTDPPGRA